MSKRAGRHTTPSTNRTEAAKPDNNRRREKRYLLYYCLALIFITAAVYQNTFQNGFSSYDDPAMIVQNNDIREISFPSLGAFFSKAYILHYHPLTMLSFATDYAVFGLDPRGFHFTNLLLHIINVLLLFLLMRKVIRADGLSFGLALLFAAHPMNVEAVAWVTARKDVLYAVFYLAALNVYLAYLRETSNRRFYYFTILLFLFSVLSKSAAVTLPFILVLIDLSERRADTKAMLFEKLPMIAISIAAGALSVFTQSETVGAAVAQGYAFTDRIVLFFYAIGYYLTQLFVPHGLSVIHLFPFKQNGFFSLSVYLIAAAGMLAIAIPLALRKVSRELFFLFAAFIICLLPVLQIVPFAQSITAERFAYMPYALALLFAGAAFARGGWLNNVTARKAFTGTAIVIVIIFSVLIVRRVDVWKTGFTLYADALEKNPGSPMVLTMCGTAKLETNEYADARQYFERAAAIDPNDALTRFSLGTAHLHLQNYRDAVDWLSKALHTNPESEDARYNRMLAYNGLAQYDSAMLDLNELIGRKPAKGEYYYARALLYSTLRDSAAAARDLERAASLGWTP
jgi:tetratricopeptide (TPR) repeat protein